MSIHSSCTGGWVVFLCTRWYTTRKGITYKAILSAPWLRRWRRHFTAVEEAINQQGFKVSLAPPLNRARPLSVMSSSLFEAVKCIVMSLRHVPATIAAVLTCITDCVLASADVHPLRRSQLGTSTHQVIIYCIRWGDFHLQVSCEQ